MDDLLSPPVRQHLKDTMTLSILIPCEVGMLFGLLFVVLYVMLSCPGLEPRSGQQNCLFRKVDIAQYNTEALTKIRCNHRTRDADQALEILDVRWAYTTRQCRDVSPTNYPTHDGSEQEVQRAAILLATDADHDRHFTRTYMSQRTRHDR